MACAFTLSFRMPHNPEKMPVIQGYWARVKDVAARTVDGETLLVPIRRNPKERVSVVTLNDSAGFLWQALASPATAEDLAVRLTAEFEVEPEAALADVTAFLSELRAAGLLEESR